MLLQYSEEGVNSNVHFFSLYQQESSMDLGNEELFGRIPRIKLSFGVTLAELSEQNPPEVIGATCVPRSGNRRV